MIIGFILSGLKKYICELNTLSRNSGISRITLYSDCLWSYIRYGCVLNHYIKGKFYMRRFFERKHILTYRKWLTILDYNDNNYTHLLKNKVDFNNYFHDFIKREWLSSKDLSYDIFLSFLKRHRSVFIKPIAGKEGEECQMVNYETDKDYYSLYQTLIISEYLIEEVVVQHSSMVFGNKSVNTIRVYTVYDNNASKAICFKTTLRVGIGDSIVDNSHSGGISYEVDLETGIIDSRGWCSSNSNGILFHPGTNICMMGRSIPYWNEVLLLCETAASKIPQVRFIGWDVAISPSGPLLIEGNNTPDLDIMEFVGNFGYYSKIKSHL